MYQVPGVRWSYLMNGKKAGSYFRKGRVVVYAVRKVGKDHSMQ